MKPATQVAVVLGGFAAVLLAGHVRLRFTFPVGLPPFEVGLAIAGAVWAGNRGREFAAALGLV